MAETLEIKYSGKEQNVTLLPGIYLFECWGSGDSTGNAKGGYATGKITLKKTTQFYCYVGGNDSNKFNGGAASGGSRYYSGGATDIRLKGGLWNDAEGLRSRIMVAGGAGCSGASGKYGKSGGGIAGTSATENYGTGGEGGTQTAGGSYRASFGAGGSGSSGSGGYPGAGGGGYYGGGGANPDGSGDDDRGGGGGSGFVSGMTGCNAVSINGTHTNQPSHYSGLVFTESSMINGSNAGTGRIMITTIEKFPESSGNQVYIKVNGSWELGTVEGEI